MLAFDVCNVSQQGERRLARIIPHGPTACIDSGTETACVLLSCGVADIISSDASKWNVGNAHNALVR
jgi:hypothetical protein